MSFCYALMIFYKPANSLPNDCSSFTFYYKSIKEPQKCGNNEMADLT